MGKVAVVTGAFSNSGSAIADELAARGYEVRTLTNRAAPAGSDMHVDALRFEREHLLAALGGADLFVNTFWIRFPRRGVTFQDAIDRSRLLFECARDAGVERVVHLSVSNAHEGKGLAYYEGKARVELALAATCPSHAIVRPTLILGPDDVLTGNIAWFLRRVPITAVPMGRGYHLQPVTRDDLARIVADVAAPDAGNVTVDAAGPERFSFAEYLRTLAAGLGVHARLVPLPAPVMLAALKPVGWALRDTILTKEELEGLQREMLVTHRDPLGTGSTREWLTANAHLLGTGYVNDTIERFTRAARAQR